VIAGAQKGGTTQLASHLACVEGVWIPRGETPAFEDPNFYEGGLKRLQNAIKKQAPHDSLVGIKRASYLAFDEVPCRIKDAYPDVKVILVLRDPVDRAVSAYFHKVKYGRMPILPVSEGLTRILNGDNLGNKRVFEILEYSRYASLVPAWQRKFRDNLIVVGNGDLRNDEIRAAKGVCRALGVDYQVARTVATNTNTGATTWLELRLLRQMHRAINTFEPATGRLGPRTQNPLKLTYGAAMRGAARIAHSSDSAKSSVMQLDTVTHERLTNHFAEDYHFTHENFDIRL